MPQVRCSLKFARRDDTREVNEDNILKNIAAASDDALLPWKVSIMPHLNA